MKTKIIFIVSLIAVMFLLAGCASTGQAIRGGRGEANVAAVQYETGDWAYLTNNKKYTIETGCTFKGRGDGKAWAKMVDGGFSCYKSGGVQGVDYKICDLDRDGNPSTDGIMINNWAYLKNDGTYSIQEGCTLEGRGDGKYWGLMAGAGYPCYLSGGQQGKDYMLCPTAKPYDLALEYAKSLEMTQFVFDEMIKKSVIVASDLVKFKFVHPDKVIDVSSPEKMINIMYFGMDTKAEAQNWVDHLFLENTQKLLNAKFDLTQKYQYAEGNVQGFSEGYDTLLKDFEKGAFAEGDAFANPGGQQEGEGDRVYLKFRQLLKGETLV